MSRNLDFRTLKANEIEVRVQSVTEKGCILLLYKDSRTDMIILDETVGPLDWKREHTRDNANCIVSIWDNEKKQWISKEDTGTESNTEKEKGVILLLAGNFMEPSSIMLIFAPILFPIAMQLGIDPIHLGILMVVNMEVGMCHPPVGLNLYVASGITKMGITELTVAVWPWLLSMLGFLVLVTYWPNLSLWLPRTLGMP